MEYLLSRGEIEGRMRRLRLLFTAGGIVCLDVIGYYPSTNLNVMLGNSTIDIYNHRGLVRREGLYDCDCNFL